MAKQHRNVRSLMRASAALAAEPAAENAPADAALASLGVVEIERSAGHAERFNTRSMDRAGRE
jgi:hypothetical protein